MLVNCFICPVCASVMRGRTVYRETRRKETRDGEKGEEGGEKRGKGERWSEVGEMRKGVGERRRGAGEWISVPPVHPLCYGTASPFPRPFLPVSLYPVHSLSETPLNRHRQSTSCAVIWTSSCGETDSAGHTKTASTTSKDTSPNFIQCSDQSTFSIAGPFQGHQYYSKRK